jgi:hypothetical protein
MKSPKATIAQRDPKDLDLFASLKLDQARSRVIQMLLGLPPHGTLTVHYPISYDPNPFQTFSVKKASIARIGVLAFR